MSIVITINGQEFNRDDDLEDDVRWSMVVDSGWDDDPQADVDLLPTIAPGSARGRIMERHRTIVCSGTAEARSPEALWGARRTLRTLVPLYTSVPFSVAEPGLPPLQVQVSAAPGSPKMRPPDGLSFDFQLTLVSTDVHRYGQERTVTVSGASSNVPVPNYGDAPAPLRIVVTSEGTVSLYDPITAREHLAGPLPAGTVLDGSTGIIRGPGGSPVPILPGFTFPTARGEDQTFSTNTAGLSITYRDTYN